MDKKAESIHKTLVVTSTNLELYSQYAHRFVDTFPHAQLDLRVYSEDYGLPCKSTHLHLQEQFVERNSYRPVSSYKYDSVRFCYKPYTIAQALQDYAQDYTRLLWIDSDTVFHKEITEDWITKNLYKEDTLMSYAGRVNYYSETGLLLFNLEHPNTKNYIDSVRKLYDNDLIYLLKEWHDSYIWDAVRQQYEAKGNTFYNVAEAVHNKVPGGHILAYLYGDTIDHMKGKRKQQGYSKEQQKH